MANASLKKQARKNKATIRTLKIGGILSNLFFISIRLIYYYSSTTKYTFIFYFISCFFSTGLSFLLWSIGSPKPEKNSLYSLEDLSQKGFVEYILYTIYITWAIYFFVAIFTDKAWLLYLIPCFLLLKHFLSIIRLFFIDRYIKMNQKSINKKVKYIRSL